VHKGHNKDLNGIVLLVASMDLPKQILSKRSPYLGHYLKGHHNMSTFTKPGSEIYVEDSETVFFAPLKTPNPYGLMVTDATKVIGSKVAWCSDCEGAVVDQGQDDVMLLLSLELHTIEHKWFEAYPPLNAKGVKETQWKFFESLTPEMQKLEQARRERMRNGMDNIHAVIEGECGCQA
jgi:hypothetical protein